MKHNKKRNTAFLYESLIKELTKAIVRKQEEKKEALEKYGAEGSGKNLPFSSLSEDLKKKDKK